MSGLAYSARVRRRLRPGDWLLMAGLVLLLGVALARDLADGLRADRARIWVHVASAAGPEAYPTVRGLPESSTAPLLPGDELREVGGEEVRGRTALHVYDRMHRAIRSEGTAPVRGMRAGAPFEARLEPQGWRYWWVGSAFAVAILAAALALWLLAPGWHLARRYFLATWCFSIIALQAGPYPASPLEGWKLIALLPLGSALTVWNAAEFTLSARPAPVALRALALAAGVTSLAMFLATFVLSAGASTVDGLRVVQGLCLAGGTLGGLTRAYLRSTPIERRQLRWVLLGFYVALLGFMPLAIAPGPATATITFAAGIAIPVATAIAVLGYRFLDVDPVISAVASYSVVGVGVLGGALALVPRAAGALAGGAGLEPAATQWLLTMGLIGVAIPVHRALRPRIDQRLFAARHARTRGFEALLDEIGRCASVEDLTRLPGERLDALLEPESIATYAREESAFTPVFVRGTGAPPAFEASSPLVTTLERRSRPLAGDAPELDAFDRAALETLGVSVVVPIRRGEALVAFTCLGRKRSGDIYTPEELAYLTAVANRCAEVLVKLDDEVVLREARALQHSLRRYVPGAVAEEIAGGRELAAEEREVTVLFVDLRGYTSLAEQRAAEEVFSTLNEYTETVSRLVRARGGTIVEFHGDGLMAVFGAPRPLEAKERAAVEAARDVLGALAARLAVGIGVATGPAFVSVAISHLANVAAAVTRNGLPALSAPRTMHLSGSCPLFRSATQRIMAAASPHFLIAFSSAWTTAGTSVSFSDR